MNRKVSQATLDRIATEEGSVVVSKGKKPEAKKVEAKKDTSVADAIDQMSESLSSAIKTMASIVTKKEKPKKIRVSNITRDGRDLISGAEFTVVYGE